MATIYTFERIEKKYLLTPRQADRLKMRLAPFTEPERYGLHSVCNIYYDTPDMALIRRSIDRPVYKEKFRLRSYGVPGPEDMIFAEIKKKYRGVVYKRRVAGTSGQIAAFLEGGEVPGQDAQIQRELHYFLRTWPISPRVFLAYDREALLGREDPELRITFDRRLRFRTDKLSLEMGDEGAPILPEERVVMEIKMPQACPLWLARILSEEGIRPASFSKYGVCYVRHLLHAGDAGKDENKC